MTSIDDRYAPPRRNEGEPPVHSGRQTSWLERNWKWFVPLGCGGALLLLAVESGTPTAVFGISFGPLPEDDATDARFSALAQRVLSRLDFLSLRDQISQRDAERRTLLYRQLAEIRTKPTDGAGSDTSEK